ncbi:UNVERIFIED_CONTAM: Retrovirus-related Pol polyprotein from transposon RE2 [Sesamum radiatum]|uniref:Retrovirus-related Pol polyprotein from transposon RE2 n=1 Tax=Sesamum radiatum TaxID=300843 RepID=A0AAW2RGX2_SESRA
MPSSVLIGDTPYSRLFPDKPLFRVTPRVFGCVCFVHLHFLIVINFLLAVKCRFLGYSRAQKGYQCYDPQSRRSFTTVDVTFFESTAYYSPNSSPTIPTTSLPLLVPPLSIPLHTEKSTRPLQVYSYRSRSTTITLTALPSLPPAAALGTPSATSANDLPIVLRKASDVEDGNGRRNACSHFDGDIGACGVYVDDILITGSDVVRIEKSKTYLPKHFVTKYLGRPKYFLGIEITHNKHGVSLFQRKYACDLFQEACLLGTKLMDNLMDFNPNFWNDDGNYLEDKIKYRRLVGKLIYLTVTRPDISFAVGLVSQFMDKPRSVHWEAALRILKYIKASLGKGLLFKQHGHVKIEAYFDANYTRSKDDKNSTSRYCTYVGWNLVIWRSKR